MAGARDKDPMVVFMPSGKRGRFPVGTPILEAARGLGVDIDSVCGGRALCGRCQVEVAEGEFAKHRITSSMENISAVGEAEARLAERRRLEACRRLSCQAKLAKDIVIDVPASSQVHHQVVRKPHEDHDITIDPVVHAYFVEVAVPTLDEALGDFERLKNALASEWGLHGLSVEASVLRDLQKALADGKRQVTVAVRNGERIVAVWSGYKEAIYGVAFDVGSTTVAAHLCDLASGEVVASAGKMNPQIRYGEDLMSRVSYVMMNPGGEQNLIDGVRRAMNELISEVVAGIDAAPSDVVEVTVVGNPIMQHLVLGINPVELGTAPFALATDGSVDTLAANLDLDINAGGHVYALPCIAGHVGADAAGVLLAEAPQAHDGVSLIVDVGTNAEILLGNSERLLAASSPTGPAFEGAQISGGQRAAPGAIERVRIDKETLAPRFRVIGSDRWSDDSGFDEKVTGICGSGIIEAIAEMFLAGILDGEGKIVESTSPHVVANGRTFSYVLHDGDPEIRITQNDVRAIQLAKAALHAGAKLLMERFGTDKVDRIRLAGAFGAHIDVKYAMVLGLIPECAHDAVSSAGNAAGTGARIALLDKSSRALIEAQVRDIEKIETAVEPRFQEHFVASMGIPNGSGDAPKRGRRRRRA
ncbi:MAG: ASKHA domain-containing protein [Woeseiaceae bacterium]|nr:ASKHA domain-containing protein [Woeseiaceae bacterium]